MLRTEYQDTLTNMRQKLTGIEFRAKKISNQLPQFQREVESSKVEWLQRLIEHKIESEARRRGVASIIKDRDRLRNSILVAAGGFILGGLLTQDKWSALNTGLAGLDGALKRYGHAGWNVLLGKRIIIAASDSVQLEGDWFPWKSLKLAMDELKKKALSGETLGNLDNVLHRLERSVRNLSMRTSQLLR